MGEAENSKSNDNNNEVLELKDIDKSFGANQVLFQTSITIKPGSIHALVGENGAGKSTMMNIIAGIHRADSGEVLLGGVPIDIHTPKLSQEHGIMLMHQELSVFPEMTVMENIYAGNLPKNFLGIINKKKLLEQTESILSDLNCGLQADQLVKNLSVANQHICEFARFLTLQPKFIILDEPTAALTEREKDIIFTFVKRLKEEYNLGILYISHRMHEIFEIANEVSILRDGYMQGTFDINQITEEEITKLMIGYDVGKIEKRKKEIDKSKIPLLEVKNMCMQHEVRNVSFEIYPGEVLGLAGLLGAKRTEIAEAIFGVRKITAGEILVNGSALFNHTVQDAIDKSIALVPGDRKLQGVVLEMSNIHNMTLAVLKHIKSGSVLSLKKEMNIYNKYRDKLSIKASSHTQSVGALSGGNQQKIVLSKWLSTNTSVLILDEPTRGIDVGAKAEIYRLIQKLAEDGYAILLITSDMLELLTLSDRVVAMYDGKVSGRLEGDEITEDAVINAISKINEVYL